MKFSLQGVVSGSLGVMALSLVMLTVTSALAQPAPEVTLDAHRVQIVHTNGYNTDYTNFNITFTNHGEYPYFDCDYGADDAFSGIEVALSPQSCAPICELAGACMDSPNPVMFPFDYDFEPFVVYTVNHARYGTFYGLNPPYAGPGTVSARLGQLAAPAPGYGCGTWNLNVEATGLNLSSITHNPMSIWLNDEDGSGPFCFNIYDAIIGNPIPKPSVPVVRRRIRRSR